MAHFKTEIFPKTRIATNDVCSVGLQKHHVTALLEIDVTESRKKIKQNKMNNNRISFTAWLIKVIGVTVKDFGRVAGFLEGKRKIVIFEDVNVSVAVEKEINGQKVPVPLVIEKANEKSTTAITSEINEARSRNLTDKDIVLHSKSTRMERLYYYLPGFLRRYFWRWLIRHPHFAYGKMGNVAITTVGMMGKANGWFIPISVHPVCFGIGKITKKPVVVNDKIEIREILNMTALLDHDVVDGGEMARFISKLSDNIEKGKEL